MFQQSNSAAHPTFSSQLGQHRPRALISLTPLIDVVFILLLFFMLASSFIHLNTINLDTPAQGAQQQSLQGAMIIEVRLDGVRYAGQNKPLDEIVKLVSDRLAKHPDQRVLVQPGAGVNLQRTVRVLDRLAAVGAAHLSLLPSPGSHTAD